MRGFLERAIEAEKEVVDTKFREDTIMDALDAARLAIDEFYNGDRAWAEAWLLKAAAANKDEAQ